MRAFTALLSVLLLPVFDLVDSSVDSIVRLGNSFHDLPIPDVQEFDLIDDEQLEAERIEAYHARGYLWPIPQYTPNTLGWRKLMDKRFSQVASIPDSGDRYEGYIQTVHSSFLAPNFTEHGFGLARAPEELTETLLQAIWEGLPTAEEESKDAITGPLQPLFIDRQDLTTLALNELQIYAESWSKVPLTPQNAYGFRLYRNESQLWMHVDQFQTHVISIIYHIDSSEDAEPWPLYIEDFQGRTHEVTLTSGDILFYESSKCFHGRPKKFNGSWYSSLFLHYFPSDGWSDTNHDLEASYAVPPHWSNDPDPDFPSELPALEMVEASFTEPDCPNSWCRSAEGETIQWSGPGINGVWMGPEFNEHPLIIAEDPEPEEL
jgi:hypothetical protein